MFVEKSVLILVILLVAFLMVFLGAAWERARRFEQMFEKSEKHLKQYRKTNKDLVKSLNEAYGTKLLAEIEDIEGELTSGRGQKTA